MSDSTDSLQVTTRDGVALLTLNRPQVLNAADTALLLRLSERLDELTAAVGRGEVRAVVLTGAGRGFCAGADLADPALKIGESDLGEHLRDHFNPVIERLRDLPAPVIAAVNGAAAGAGMSLALACDIVLAAESASFLQAFSRIGLIPDAGSTFFLPRLVGESRARALSILADRISADQALQFGMVWQVLPDAQLLPAARAMAGRLATQPTRAFALTKQAINASFDHDFRTQLALEADLQSAAGRTDDFREGVAAFIGKRKPVFTGR